MCLFLEDALAILTFNLENVMTFVKNNYSWEEDAVTVFDCHSLFVLLYVIMWSCVNTLTGLGVGFKMNTAPKKSHNTEEVSLNSCDTSLQASDFSFTNSCKQHRFD